VLMFSPFRLKITPYHDSTSLNWKLCLCITAESTPDDGYGSLASIGRLIRVRLSSNFGHAKP
jgi:hypothetical protein